MLKFFSDFLSRRRARKEVLRVRHVLEEIEYVLYTRRPTGRLVIAAHYLGGLVWEDNNRACAELVSAYAHLRGWWGGSTPPTIISKSEAKSLRLAHQELSSWWATRQKS
ncbi:hypothetical protein COW81_00750 [Candidatus Campbellbacteria bacterium CG22_combo_CG10-13_8_21_14_all_36_13]|uniref:Uncharacterized protein n=1 Tax=Candidatus Campbellbacteria bacterium CG22_combo_CG10-13_8_21_14_all_36_13 TaxID=1974529 RepID=A0A2H0DYT1_9BACT|nr:MAG: hypothetical protein COW81_00750 [Candidatus Campbellbacteria bacterium CG22_combo_CG10-13_8_21_14_all_36_13]